MTTTTAEYWSVIPQDGVEYPLQTLAKNIESWGDDRQGVVPLRGEDTTIPWIPGDRENERVVASRVMPLSMWVIGHNDDGIVPSGSSRRQAFEQNWRTLQRILHNQGRPFTLRKRFYDEAYTLRTADARVRYESGLTPSMLGMTGAKFTVDLRMADPFFYSTTQTDLALNTATAAGVLSPTVVGDYDPRKLIFVGTAGAAGASGITFQCSTSGHTWYVDQSANAGETLMFDFGNQLARINDINVTPQIHHSGSNDWFRINRGAATITVSASAGAFSGTLSYKGVWN